MNDTEIQLVLEKCVHAPPATVFKAWTDPDRMKQWFAPDDMQVSRTEAELRVGGRYLIEMRDPESGRQYTVSGEYLEVVEDRKLVFDWKWHDGVERTVVTVEFEARDAGTRVKLTHRGFGRKEYADNHREGWASCLGNLEDYFD